MRVRQSQHWRGWTWLALAVVWVQLAVAFGHVAGPAPLHVEGPLLRALEAWVAGSSEETHDLDRNAEHDRDRASPCDSCWLQGVAAALLLPVAAAIVSALLALSSLQPVRVASPPAFAIVVAYLVRGPPNAFPR